MKLLFTIIVLSISFANLARTINPANMTLRRNYIPVKKVYRQLRVSKLPTINGKLDAKKILIMSSKLKKWSSLGLNRVQVKKVNLVVRALKANNLYSAKKMWIGFINMLKDQTIPLDLNVLIQQLIRESYLESNKALKFYADRVRHYNDMKKEIRDHLNSLKRMRTSCVRCSRSITNDMQLETNKWEDQLASIGDDAQLANIDLQNMLQRQQQLLQTLSEISRMLYDTAMAIIRKIA